MEGSEEIQKETTGLSHVELDFNFHVVLCIRTVTPFNCLTDTL